MSLNRRKLAAFATVSSVVLAMASDSLAQAGANVPEPAGQAVEAIIKPIEPPANANELPQEVNAVLTSLADDLARISQALEGRQDDVALCWAANKAGPLGGPSLYECLARTAAETRTTWDAAVGTFRTFGQGLTKVGVQIDGVKTYVAGQQREIGEQRHILETRIAEAKGKLQLVKVALARKQPLTPEQERDVRKLVDDVLTGYMKTRLLKQRQNFFDQTSQRLIAYRGLVDELQGENDVLEHQSRNRSDAWNSILEAIQSQASIAILDERFSRVNAGLERLGPLLGSIRKLQNAELPALPGPADAPATVSWKLPTENLGDLINRVLTETQ